MRALASRAQRKMFRVVAFTLCALVSYSASGGREVAAQSRADNEPTAIDVGPDDTNSNAPTDYDVESAEWNGLLRFIALARGMGLEVVTTDALDWQDLGADDVLFVLYPTERLEPSHLAAFVRNGGHALVADDFGRSREAMGRLSILRTEAVGVDASRYEGDRSYAPVARPWMKSHPLAVGVAELVTNHPAVLRDVKGADVVFGFGANEGVVAAGELGRGRVVVLSDPSVFINRMLQFGGNLQFAINAIRYLARPSATKRLVILHGSFAMYGEPRGVLDDGTLGGRVDSAMADLNRLLDEQNDYMLTPEGLLAVAIMLGVTIGLGLLFPLPLRLNRKLDGSWTRAQEAGRAPSDFEAIVSEFETSAPGDKSYALPAAIMRDTLNRRLEQLLEREDPLGTLAAHELGDQVSQVRGQAAGAIASALHQHLKALPTRWQAASPWTVGYLSQRQFERLYNETKRLEQAIGAVSPSG